MQISPLPLLQTLAICSSPFEGAASIPLPPGSVSRTCLLRSSGAPGREPLGSTETCSESTEGHSSPACIGDERVILLCDTNMTTVVLSVLIKAQFILLHRTYIVAYAETHRPCRNQRHTWRAPLQNQFYADRKCCDWSVSARTPPYVCNCSPQPPPVCSIHLDDATAATGQRHQCAHHTPATGGEERES